MSTILFNLHDVVLLGIAYLSILFLFLFAFVVNQNRLSQITICFFFVCTGVIPLDVLILFGEGFREYSIENLPNWFYVFEFGYWLQGPFIFWFCKSLLNKNYRLDWRDIIYVMPFILYLAHQIFVYHLLSVDVKVELLRAYDVYGGSKSIYFVDLTRESLRLYFFARCLFELKNHIGIKQIKTRDYEDNLIRWLYYFVVGYTVKAVFGEILALGVILNVVSGFDFDFGMIGLISNYCECLFLGGMLIYLARGFFPVSDKVKLSNKNREHKSGGVDNNVLIKLEKLMKTEKPYLDATLTRAGLAQQMAVSPRALSNIINTGFSCNFFSYINRYRIEEAKMLLTDVEKKESAVLDVMFEVGFQNKATFNSLFKKLEGMTPSEYKKQHSSDASTLLE